MRLFIATPVNFPLYGFVKSKLSKYIKGKWVEGWNLHLTHKFIGEGDAEDFKFGLEIPNEDIEISGLEILGGRILYMKAHSPNISVINTQINQKLNLQNEKPFLPHVTLCRIKEFDKKVFDELKNINIGFKVPFEVYLYKSTLTKKGPIYEKIYKY